VTCLIGITLKNRSKIGIVHRPFLDATSPYGQTYFGSPEIGVFRCKYDRNWTKEEYLSREIEYVPPFHPEENVDESTHLRTVISLFHFSDVIKKSLSILMPCEYEKIGGAGNKFLLMVENKTDVYYYMNKGLSSWDVCAAEPLL